MDVRPHETRVIWAFWLACGLVAVAGLVPLLLGGTSGRVTNVIFPYWIAAIALGASALLQNRGRPIATGLYFVAGLAVVYGILAMLAVPLRLAVIGTCPAPPASCGFGLERPLTEGESTGMAFAIGLGVVGILVGFFGLVVLFRRQVAPRVQTEPTTPPARRIPPVRSTPAPSAPEPEPEPQPEPEPEPEAPAGATPIEAEMPELPAPEEELELPAHVDEEAPELPAPKPD